MMSGFEINSSSFNDSRDTEPLEFPLWKSLVAVSIFLFVGLLLPITLFMNLSVFVALVKSKTTCKAMLILYGSLLLGLCVDKLLICVDQSVTVPVVIRYCICLNLAISLLSAPRAFFLVYSVVIVTCQSVVQLLIIKGRTKWKTSYTRSLVCVLLSAVVATFWSALYTTSGIVSGSPGHCKSLCSTPGNSTSSDEFDFEVIVVGGYIAFTVVPAVAVTIVTSVWALFLVKKQIILKSDSEDIRLNRKITLFPLLMVVLLVCNSLIGYLLTFIIGEVLKEANLEPFYGNWAIFISNVGHFILDLLHGLSYPLILLYLNNALRATWKSMFCKVVKRVELNKKQPNSSPSTDDTLK